MKNESITDDLRYSGNDRIGNVPWGTHFCHFYAYREDLADVLIPYFKAGLDSNEACIWVTSYPLDKAQAAALLRKTVSDGDSYLDSGQIEILDYTEWYTKTDGFNADRVLKSWIDKHDDAITRGFAGLRLTGNTFWLEQADWDDFVAYEQAVNEAIGNYRMLAICAYSLDKCDVNEVIDIVKNHQFALIKRKGAWEAIEISEAKRVARQVEHLAATTRQLKFLSAQLLETQEKESGRIGRELHDGIGQSLAALKFRVENALRDLIQEGLSKHADSLERIVPIIQSGIKEVRRIQRELRPPSLDDLGLLPTLASFRRDFHETYSHICVESAIEPVECDLSDTQKTVIYRIVQEAFNNAATHSQASTIRLSLKRTNTKIVLSIIDNGRGFDLKHVRARDRTRQGLGLSSMKERAELSGGTLAIETAPSRGTTISAWWPLNHSR